MSDKLRDTLPGRWEAALATPDRAFAVDARDGSVFSVGELDVLSRKAAGMLARQGLEAGGRLVVIAAPEIETLVTLLGALRAGVTAALLHPQAPPGRIREVLDLWPGARVLSPGPQMTDALLDAEPAPPPPPLDPDADAVIIFSSGTTGAARGVRLSWRALAGGLSRLAQVPTVQGSPGSVLVPQTREGATALLHTVTGYRMSTLGPLLRQSTAVLLPPDASASVMLGLAADRGVQVLHVGPGFVRACNRAPARHRALVGPDLRALLVGGGALSEDERQRLADGLEVTVVHTYGLTETTGMCAAAMVTPGGPLTPGMGRPIVPVRVVDPAGRPTDGEGLIEVAPLTPPLGYLGGESPFADPEGRWVRTWDLGRLDAEGNLHVRGRASRLHTLPSGEKLQLEDLEREIREGLGVEVAVVPVATPDREPRLGALVVDVALSPAWERRARAALRERLPDHAIPTLWGTCGALPQTATGKVDLAATSAALAAL